MTSTSFLRSSLAAGAEGDVIDAALGIASGSPLDRLRSERPEVRDRTQSSYTTLLDRPEPGSLSLAERLAIALRIANVNAASGLAKHYRERLALASNEALLRAIDDNLLGSLTPRLGAMVRHADLLTLEPSRASQSDLSLLAARGLSSSEIVTLSQIIAFVAYQARVVASLKLIAEVE
ncbi:MAG TPA: CMD domain protein [Roseiarcus sp.]|nr:CMD domain protein [Roseiarcus sp.]